MQRLILASKSLARRTMLENAGLAFDCIPADIDEDAFKTRGSPAEIAQVLADEKALHIARENPAALVIGADQVLEMNGKLLSKAKDTAEASTKLETLNGRTHHLVSAVSLARGGEILWRHSDQAALTMHNLSAAQIEAYIGGAGEALTRSVGGYELESRGAWLFEKIDGDFFTILGMPLLPLLSALSDHGFGLT